MIIATLFLINIMKNCFKCQFVEWQCEGKKIAEIFIDLSVALICSFFSFDFSDLSESLTLNCFCSYFVINIKNLFFIFIRIKNCITFYYLKLSNYFIDLFTFFRFAQKIRSFDLM